MRKRIVLLMLVASIMAGLPLLAAETTIQRGIDVFTTRGDGSTYIDFGQNPLPAGFFCKSSAAFTDSGDRRIGAGQRSPRHHNYIDRTAGCNARHL